MKHFPRGSGLILVVFAGLLAIALSIFHTEPLRGVLTPVYKATAAVSGWISDMTARSGDYDRLAAENEELRQTIRELELLTLKSEDALRENRRLRALLRLSTQQPELQFLDAAVTARSTSNWSDRFTLNRGSEDGAAVGNCVTDHYGNLVGILTETGPHWATVTTILDPGIALGARVARTDDCAIAQGSFDRMTNGQLSLVFLPPESALTAGDRVVTSGLGEHYPAYLTIGTVRFVGTEPDGISRYAVLEPGADLARLRWAYIITD